MNDDKKREWEYLKYSYAAASIFPIKILLNNGLIRDMRTDKKIPIVHVQLNPTNRCNRNCSFCSCSERDKKLELAHEHIIEIMRKAKDCGCQSVTITGGGEPLMHPKINEIIRDIDSMGIEIGLVTNGDLLKRLADESLKRMIWCRVSVSDFGTFDEVFTYYLKKNIERGKTVNWSFSYVISRAPDFDKMRNIIEFANDNNFSHIRIVSDLLDLEGVPDMDYIKTTLEGMGVNDSRVNYQERKDFGTGNEKCLISLLKPVIGADGYLYPCCGVQYALKEPSRDYEKTMRMGKAEDIYKIYENQSYFNGSVCAKCYYNDYNYLLNLLFTDIKHIKFV